MTREEETNNYAYNHYTSEDDTSYNLIKNAIEWADKTMIEKAYKWIKENFGNYIGVDVSDYDIHDEEFADDFLKAMKG